MTHPFFTAGLLALALALGALGQAARGAEASDIARYGDQNLARSLSEGNPIVPGLFADPSLAKFGDTFYLYSTTDGFGWPAGRWVVWKSKDFVHWSFSGESFPEITGQQNWAPGKPTLRGGRYWMPFTWRGDGNYLAVADRPEGPFHFANGGRKLTDSIDAELFVDDDGTPYVIYGGTHVHVSRLKPDLSGLDGPGPGTEIDFHKGYVEGPFLFKRGGKYYACAANLGYAEYRIIYGMSDKIAGPYTFPQDNLIIAPVPADHLWGTGHGNVLRLSARADDWVLIYLRSRMGERVDPFRGGGNVYRQVCAERLRFNADGTIRPITPSREGAGLLARSTERGTNLALGRPATASSWLPRYEPGKANDGGFGTRWIVGDGPGDGPPWWQVDLGKAQRVARTEISFNYPTEITPYALEWSLDAKRWRPYADHEHDATHASPKVDRRPVTTRYLRVRFPAASTGGVPAGLWEFKAFDRP